MAAKRIEERSAFSSKGVDRSGPYPIVREVLLCGATSANRRRYRKEAFAGDRVKRYEGRPVFLNHGRGNQPREYQDKVAVVENPRLRADGLPVGDLAVNPKHPLAETFLWDAEHKPHSCGMSHVARCETVTSSDGWEEITEVVSVESVDLVTDPATTKGFYEGKNVAKTVKQLAEWVKRHAKANAKQKTFATLVAEMDGMDAMPIDAPPADDADPADGIKDAFAQAVMHLAKQALDGEIDSKEFAKKVKKLVDSHADISSDSSAEEPAEEPAEDAPEESEDMPKESKLPQPWDVLRECQAEGYTPSATELETLALQPDAEKRKAFVKEQKIKTVNAKAEKPSAPARKPGAEVKEAKTPKNLKELREILAEM